MSHESMGSIAPSSQLTTENAVTLGALATRVARRWWLILLAGLVAGAAGYGIARMLPKRYIAITTILPPQQQQSSAASALASLTSLANLGGAGVGIKSPADQYVAFMQSVTVGDRIIDAFDLGQVYKKKFRDETRKALRMNVRIAVGKKDGLISVEVEDTDPKRAADIANAHVAGLRELTNTLAVSEAQGRRRFFEEQLKVSKDNLVRSQLALQESGVSRDALKAEPKAVTEDYARLKAQITAAEARLQALRTGLRDGAPELTQQTALLDSLRREQARLERRSPSAGDSDYVSRFREFKYQETLFELFARQYELARVDESREGALVQVVDPATAPERPSHPKPLLVGLAFAALAMALASAYWALRSPAGRQRR